jgi:hypothetical protein
VRTLHYLRLFFAAGLWSNPTIWRDVDRMPDGESYCRSYEYTNKYARAYEYARTHQYTQAHRYAGAHRHP